MRLTVLPRRHHIAMAIAMALTAPPLLANPAGDIPASDAAAAGRTQAGAAIATTLDNVVVTGSRIARAELESVMPISVVDFEEVKETGRFSLYDAFQLNPAIGPGLGEMNSMRQEYDKGVANIDLRGMGTNRSLVLVDGLRWVSGGARTAAVDLNTIPSALIERIETVTGGASAIYGADAVTAGSTWSCASAWTAPPRR